MSVNVFKFAEVTEGTYLGAKKIRWTELVQIRLVDDISAPVEQEYELVSEYYEPVANMVVTKPDGGADVGDSAIISFDGGFNFGDVLSVGVSLDGGEVQPISFTLEYISSASEAAARFAEEIALQIIGTSIDSTYGSPDDPADIQVWSSSAGGTVTVSAPLVVRAAVDLPAEVQEFMLAVKNLD